MGFEPINIEEVAFPEALISKESKVLFRVGEIELPLPITNDEYDKIKIHSAYSFDFWEAEVATLDYSGRSDLIEDDEPWDKYFAFSDLRSSPEVRNYIYSLLGEDPNQSYYELSKKHGLDLSRLY